MFEKRSRFLFLILVLFSLGLCSFLEGGPVFAQTTSADQFFNLSHGGLTRKYLVHVPTNYSGSSKVPLVIALHGGGGDAENSPAFFHLNPKSDAEGFLLAYPEGTGSDYAGKHFGVWNSGECCGSAASNNVDDVGFIRSMIDKLKIDYNVDEKRIYVMGFSNGSQMAFRLACEMSDKIAAIASGGNPNTPISCNPAKPIPIFFFQGTADTCAPYLGSSECGVCMADFFINVLGVPVERSPFVCEAGSSYMAKWKDLNGCTGALQTTYQNGNATCSTYGQCKNDVKVTSCLVSGMGHTWPGPNADYGHVPACETNPYGYVCNQWKSTMGPLSQDLDANTMIWNFFKSIDVDAPTIPTNLSATLFFASSVSPADGVNIAWTASNDNNGVVGYKIYRNGVQIATQATPTTYSDKGVSPSTSYSYTVSAYDAAGNESAQSSPKSVTTQAACTNLDFISGGTSYALTTNAVATTVAPGGNYAVKCDYGANTDSINAVVGSGTCNWYNFSGTTANFNCKAGPSEGVFQNWCSVASNTSNNNCARRDQINSISVIVPTPTPTPTPTQIQLSGWTWCAFENGQCAFTGSKEVQFGVNGKYSTKTLAGSTPCTWSVFGDPAPGVAKQCWYRDVGLAPATCGNGALDTGEECDYKKYPAIAYGTTCASKLGNSAATGTLTCTQDCKISTAQCTAPVLLNKDCILAAVEKRETALATTQDIYVPVIKQIINTRKADLKAAWSIENQTERKTAIRAAWSKFNTAKTSAIAALKKAKTTAWTTYTNDRKVCGKNAYYDDTTSSYVDMYW